MRYEIGVDCMMFGSDYPHVEGTWPRTFDWVAATLGGIPEAEQRKILGGNAARLYGFDLDLLEPHRGSASASRSRSSPSAARCRRSRTPRSIAPAP